MHKLKALVGENFVIAIDSNPTTGYSWHPEYDEGALQLVDSKFISQSNLIGSPGRMEFEFKPLRAGSFAVNMTYSRSWEKEHAKKEQWIIEVS